MVRAGHQDARRAAIADAVWSVVEHQGVDAVSMRSVAAAAGVSMSGIQHYFSKKSDLLDHALEHVRHRTDMRITGRANEFAGNGATTVVAMLHELLGEHPDVRRGLRAHAAVGGRSVVAGPTGGLTGRDDDHLAFLCSVLADRSRRGLIADCDPEAEAYGLWTLACGLGGDVALRGAPVERARAVLRCQLARHSLSPSGPSREPGRDAPAARGCAAGHVVSGDRSPGARRRGRLAEADGVLQGSVL